MWCASRLGLSGSDVLLCSRRLSTQRQAKQRHQILDFLPLSVSYREAHHGVRYVFASSPFARPDSNTDIPHGHSHARLPTVWGQWREKQGDSRAQHVDPLPPPPPLQQCYFNLSHRHACVCVCVSGFGRVCPSCCCCASPMRFSCQCPADTHMSCRPALLPPMATETSHSYAAKRKRYSATHRLHLIDVECAASLAALRPT